MSTLKEEQLAQAYSRPVENLTQPFKPVRRPVAGATDILRRRKNPFMDGGIDAEKLNPKITDPANKEATIDNPNFDPQAVMGLTRPIAEIIILITCQEDVLVSAMSDFDVLEKEVNRLFLQFTDVEIISQMPAVTDAIEAIGQSSVEVQSDNEESNSLDPEKKPSPVQTGLQRG